jgi:hypothetical protein
MVNITSPILVQNAKKKELEIKKASITKLIRILCSLLKEYLLVKFFIGFLEDMLIIVM